MIAFLHTSPSHIDRFEKWVRKYDDHIKINHYVNENLLSVALSKGILDQDSFTHEINKIRKDAPQFIICTCSSYGAICNENENVFRIDQPVADYLVSNFNKIGIAYTVDSTKNTSKELLISRAKLKDKFIEIVEYNCTNCWTYFETEQYHKYETEIANAIKQNIGNEAVVFLAQASMEGAIKHLKKDHRTFISSGEYGVKKFLERVGKNS